MIEFFRSFIVDEPAFVSPGLILSLLGPCGNARANVTEFIRQYRFYQVISEMVNT